MPKREYEIKLWKEIKSELMGKVKHFKDETFGELQEMEL